MAEEKNLAERLVELSVYVPVGIAATLLDELPSLAEKGRVRVSGQVQVARVIGKMALSEAERRLRPRPSAPHSPSSGGVPGPPASPGAAGAGAAARSPAAPAASRGPGAADTTGPGSESPPRPAALPIPGYDTLAASQVVQRLGSLTPDELEAVRRYEVANRGRRTVLHRIAQLSSREGRASA